MKAMMQIQMTIQAQTFLFVYQGLGWFEAVYLPWA